MSPWNWRRSLIMLLAGLALGAGRPGRAQAICCPMPFGDDWQLVSQGQMNFVRLDRAAGRVQLIPNIRFTGNAEEFVLVIPTPTEPALTPVDKAIWTQLIALTAPTFPRRSSGSGDYGCTERYDVLAPDGTGGSADDVNVIRQQTVGAFIATLVTSPNPGALVDYLRRSGVPVTDAEARAFAPYTSRGWVFTVMRLDTSRPGTTVPANGWDNNVDPVLLTYAAPTLEVPLEILSINRGTFLPLVFFVVDDHRTTLPGFATVYANNLSRDEAAAAARLYPALAGWLAPGRTLTRLDHTYSSADEMTGSLLLTDAPTDAEFRRVNGVRQGALPLEWLLWLGLPGLGGAWNRWRGRRRN